MIDPPGEKLFFSAFGLFAGIGLAWWFSIGFWWGLLAAIVGLVVGYIGRPGNV